MLLPRLDVEWIWFSWSDSSAIGEVGQIVINIAAYDGTASVVLDEYQKNSAPIFIEPCWYDVLGIAFWPILTSRKFMLDALSTVIFKPFD